MHLLKMIFCKNVLVILPVSFSTKKLKRVKKETILLAQIDQMHLMASFLQVVHASCILSYALQETYSLIVPS